jgi:DNA-binding transcriptional MerR regulator
MRIGELATRTGASVRALRYYEEQGLLSAQRSARAQRVYADDAVDRVVLLRRLYRAGLNSSTISSVLPCVDSPSAAVTGETLAVMRREQDRIGEQIAELTTTREHLQYLIDAATAYHHEQLAPHTLSA